jgi:hypothetical protein
MTERLILLDGRKEAEYSIKKIYREAKSFFPPNIFNNQIEEILPFDYTILDKIKKRITYKNKEFFALELHTILKIVSNYKAPSLLSLDEPIINYNVILIGHNIGGRVFVSQFGDEDLTKLIAHEEAHRNGLFDHEYGKQVNCIMTSGRLNNVNKFCDECYEKLKSIKKT